VLLRLHARQCATCSEKLRTIAPLALSPDETAWLEQGLVRAQQLFEQDAARLVAGLPIESDADGSHDLALSDSPFQPRSATGKAGTLSVVRIGSRL
jgi:hypothetical protein